MYASACAGSLILGSFNKSWIPSSICLIVIAGRQSFSSSSNDKQTVPYHKCYNHQYIIQIVKLIFKIVLKYYLYLPDGYTLGWNSGGSNLHLGGLDG